MTLEWDRSAVQRESSSITALDAHAGGEPLRIITSGIPEVQGSTMLERRQYVSENLDYIRRALCWEPRGHRNMYGCILTPPVTPEADFGVLFMHNEGYSTMCGHGIIALTAALVEIGAIRRTGDEIPATFDTPAGVVYATAHRKRDVHVDRVSFVNVPSFVYAVDVDISVPDVGRITVDVAYGGAFYAILPSERVRLRVTEENAPQLAQSRLRSKTR